MRELDLNNPDKIKARNSVYNCYEDLEKELEKNPSDQGLLIKLRITSRIIKNIDMILN